jgi:hypothetical protein
MKNVNDHRHAGGGRLIPSDSYSDQPYAVKTDDGAWLCVLTTGAGREGEGGQHIIAQRSMDQGLTWTDRVAIEPATGPEASWAVLAKAASGRVFCFYTYNADNLRRIKAVDPSFAQGRAGDGMFRDGYCQRVDSLGAYAFRYSDDHGRTWSADRCTIPVREFDIDKENVADGQVRFFWNVGRPFLSRGSVYLPMHKVGNFGYGFFTRSEGALLRSDDLLAVSNPAEASWVTLPEGRVGLRAHEGPIAEEHSFAELTDGSFHCVYRTVSGYPAVSWSRDRGATWSAPEPMRRVDERPLKNPRAANFAWRCQNGRYLYWFHNHGGPIVLERHAVDASFPYRAARNPVWMCGGVEYDAPGGRRIRWSEPEIVLYDDDPFIRMSYPDLLEDGGRYFVTETNKHAARVHELDAAQLQGLWDQAAGKAVAAPVPVLEWVGPSDSRAATCPAPRLPLFVERDEDSPDGRGRDTRAGITIELELSLNQLAPRQILLDGRDRYGRGLLVRTNTEESIEVLLSDGATCVLWDTDPGAVRPRAVHHLVAIIDGGPRVISYVLDGRLLDGGRRRQFGWGRFSPRFADPNGGDQVRIAPRARGTIGLVRLYDRALTTSQAVGRYREWFGSFA